MVKKLNEIFEKQRSLMGKYHKIEAENGLLHSWDIPVDINDRFGQAQLKCLAWRFTEELGEILDNVQKENSGLKDEIADALHFLVEFTILADIGPQDVVKDKRIVNPLDNLFANILENQENTNIYLHVKPRAVKSKQALNYTVGRIIEALSCACNLLKNRPWKQSYTETDYTKFKEEAVRTWHRFVELCIIAGMGSKDLYNSYFNKSGKNENRIDDGY